MDDVRLPRGGILRGRLRVDRGSAAQRRIHVAILRAGKPGAPHRVVAQTSAEGGFVLEGLEPGSLAVTVHLPELGFVTQIVEILGGQTTEATFELGERLTLAGVVSRWDGKPAAGAALDAYRRVGTVSTEIPGRAPDDMTGNRVLADGAGRFRLAGLEAGTYRLRVTQREAPPVEMDVTVPRGPVEVQLPAPAECEVVLTDAEDRPIAGRVIAAQESARLYSGTGVGDEQGTLRFTNLPAGRYRFQAVVDGLPSAEAELAAGGRARVVLKQTVR